MTHRERILTALEHREPDRVPMDLGGMRSTGIMAIAFNKLKSYLKNDHFPTRVYDLIQQLAEPPMELLDMFGFDVVNAGRDWNVKWNPWTLPDGSSCEIPEWFNPVNENGSWKVYSEDGILIAEMPEGVIYFTQKCYPLRDREDIPDRETLKELMGRVSWGGIPTPEYYGGMSPKNLSRLATHVRDLKTASDRAIMIGFGGNLFEWASFLRGMDNVLMDLVSDRKRIEKLLDVLVEIHIGNLEKLLKAVGEHIDVIQCGDDLGSEDGPLFSPKIYREVFLPRHKTIYAHINRFTKAKVFLHSCGSVYKLLPDLIEAGVDIINPVQINSRDMEPEVLKKEFGKDICFWGGGIDTQHILGEASPEKVRDEVKRNVDIFAPSGGFVFCQVHNILANVPPENVVAMWDAL